MRQLIAGNWKMNGLWDEAAAIVGPLREGSNGLACDLLVCPPFTQIVTVAHVLAGSPVAVGGQDCHVNEKGAHTGDISAAMLRDAGASWVILGHSERRADHHESDALIQAKGFPYSLPDLLPDPRLVDLYRDGHYVTLRLTASMYHRFHAPYTCTIDHVTYIAGDTWNERLWGSIQSADHSP